LYIDRRCARLRNRILKKIFLFMVAGAVEKGPIAAFKAEQLVNHEAV
jgi:hypothetical protein